MFGNVLFFFFAQTVQHVRSKFPNQGSSPRPPALEVQSLNHCTTREVPSGRTITSQQVFTSWIGAPPGHVQVMGDMRRTRSLQTRSKKKRGRVIY